MQFGMKLRLGTIRGGKRGWEQCEKNGVVPLASRCLPLVHSNLYPHTPGNTTHVLQRCGNCLNVRLFTIAQSSGAIKGGLVGKKDGSNFQDKCTGMNALNSVQLQTHNYEDYGTFHALICPYCKPLARVQLFVVFLRHLNCVYPKATRSA